MRIGTKVTPCNLCALDWQANGHQREPVSSNLVLKPRPRPIPQQLPPTSISSPPSESHSAMIPPSNENTPVSMPEVQSNTDAVSLAVKVELVGTTHTEQMKTTIVVGDSKPNSIKKHQPSTKPMRVSPKITARMQCTKHSPFTHTMHSDTTAKRVSKVSAKAQAALEETASKKRQADVNGDSVRIQLKKVKSNPPTGSAARTASKKNIAVSRSSPASSQQAVVHTEAEEEDSHSDNAKNDDVELVVTKNEDKSATDELKRFMKDWISPVYAFFEPFPKIVEENGRWAHVFKCQGKGCKTTVRHYLDKGDVRSTGNMRKHVRSCWGEEVLRAADEAKDANEVRKKIVGSVLRNGSITASFERKGKGKNNVLASSAYQGRDKGRDCSLGIRESAAV
ncbi:hypothetical protein DFJ58DRAFT_852836 [Suillus subalutaceus]|uniref:uncharacterized protein n=1 Tax=Suillus subalutaceus TaxID=48586 RepID=UPI001B8836B9|nr:uncharacterized protein DFJ58DRAFT_852836 [Suillus subalutaceus]KAG1844640.1 hypothetical protein DFJ58DRAFT_852836 [Suillus subalutaceus]